VVRHIVDGGRLVNEVTRQKRLDLYYDCPEETEGRYRQCGCPVVKKTRWASEFCPISKWSAKCCLCVSPKYVSWLCRGKS
jgi:hypothetical protein